jgi:diguanylate cyclase (GGDEF)-like protein
MDRAEVEVEGRHRALHDPITGLPNRTLALDRLDQALRRGGDSTVAVIVVDLDRFKRINDTYGVAVGDEVVHAVGVSLRALAPPTDTVARLAGDSFAVICAESGDAEAAGSMAARIVGVLRTPVHAAGEELSLTVSVGVAIGGAGDEAGDLLRDADTALDRAKAHGRDRFELFDQALRARAVDRVQLERDLNGAAARGELYVVHQPIVSISGGHVTGTEALVRWRHPDRGVVPPGDFIGLAEETGLIAEIGTWVLRQACADVAARCRAGSPMTCHVNLSPRQAADASLPDLVAEVLRESGLPAEALVLELTESSLMEAGEGPLSVMQGVRALGVRLVLDDFGTGYSSLARLRSFPVDGLKIDRSFIADLDTDPQGALLVAGIVEMARALGLTVVAEGVETPLQLARLRLIGCRYAQGFLLARPADAAELDRLMASGSLLPAAA